MRRIIDGSLTICVIARKKPGPTSYVDRASELKMSEKVFAKESLRKGPLTNREVNVPEMDDGLNQVADMPTEDKKTAKYHGDRIKGAYARSGEDKERNGYQLLFEDGAQDSEDEVKRIREETEGQTPEERDNAGQEHLFLELQNVKKEIEEEEKEYEKENGEPMRGGLAGARPTDSDPIHTFEEIRDRIRELNIKAKNQRDLDHDHDILQQAIVLGAAAGITKTVMDTPFDMMTEFLGAIQQEEGIDLRVAIGILQGIQKAVTFPIEVARFFAQQQERQSAINIGKNPENREFDVEGHLALLDQEPKAFSGFQVNIPGLTKAAEGLGDYRLGTAADPSADGPDGPDHAPIGESFGQRGSGGRTIAKE